MSVIEFLIPSLLFAPLLSKNPDPFNFSWLTNCSKARVEGCKNETSFYQFVSIFVFGDMSSGSHRLVCSSSTNDAPELMTWYKICTNNLKTCGRTLTRILQSY